MTPPTERRHDATSAPAAHSGVDETAAAGASAAGTAVTGFGPPAAAGEVGTLGPYRVVKELGKGGMGAVYAALDTRLDRRLALKVMLPQFAAAPASRERFLREARAAARVKHDHVVTVYEADERNGVPYIAMEYLEGYPLDEFLKKKGNPTPAQVLRLAAEAAAGLAAAHRQGLVHRDVKPGNLWLEAPAGRVKVLDFGLARPVDAEVELTKSGAIVGTPAYMSPEQARGEKVDHRTDLFSLGAVLYRLLVGRLPFQGPNTMAVLIALGTVEPPPVRDLNPAVPEELAALVHQLLAKSPAARPASAEEVVKRVRAIMQGQAAARARALERSVSQPQVIPSQVIVPILVTAQAANPFAELDASATELEPAVIPRATPAGRKPGGRAQWAVAAGLAALVLAVFGGVIIVVRNRDGSETKIEVPSGAPVALKDAKTGKVPAQVGPGAKAATAATADRKAVEWVLSVGGGVRVNGDQRRWLHAADGLPQDALTLHEVLLADRPGVTDAGLANLAGCRELRDVYLEKTPVTDAGMTHLKGLDLAALGLAQTRVTDDGLAHFKGCRRLVHLNLGGTKVTDAGLAHLRDNPEMKQLDLAATGVTDAALPQIKGYPRLDELNLDRTAVTDAGLAHLEGHPKLAEVSLAQTTVTDAGLAHLQGCKALTRLNVTATKVTAKGLADFHAAVPGCRIEHEGGVIEAVDVDRRAAEWVLSVGGRVAVNARSEVRAAADLPKGAFALVTVDLEEKPVTAAGLAAFRNCRSLDTVNLSASRVTDEGLVHFQDCPKMGHLILSRTAVSDAGLAHLKDVKELRVLVAWGTKVTDAGLAHLKDCPKLVLLHIDGLPVTDAGLDHLTHCRNLRNLQVRGTKVTAAGLARFHAAVPGCLVEHDGGNIEPRK